MNAPDSVPAPTSPASGTRRSLIGAIALGATLLAMWMVQHVYLGIFHDAQIYTLQALARLAPGELGGDLFLRFGSQDRFTIFGTVYAHMIEWLGVGAAPAVMVFLAQLGFCAGFVYFARRVLPTRLVWIAVALVMLVPYTYGARKVFFVVEDFITPRLFAEGLVLGGLGAVLDRRWWWAAVLLALATLMHPIMAAAGFIVVLFLEEVPRRVRFGLFIALTLAALVTFALLASSGIELRFDDDWWQLVHGGLSYLFPLEWRVGDWARVIVVASILGAGLVTLDGARARSLCRAALFAGGAGILLNVAGGDLGRFVFVSAIQPWRMLWLSTVIAAMFTPSIAVELWRRGDLARGAALLLLSAQLLADERYALTVAGIAVVLLVAALRPGPPNRLARLAFFGGCAVALLGVTVNLLSGSLVARPIMDLHHFPQWMLTLRTMFATGAVTSVVFVAVWWWVEHRRVPSAMGALAVLAVVAVLALAPTTLALWRYTLYNRATRAAFEPWRARIPVRSEVLWFDDPLASWILLERPSFVSNVQTSSSVFSRGAALTAWHRIDALGPFLDTEPAVAWRAPIPKEQQLPTTLAAVCANVDVRFIVTRKDLSAPPIATLPADIDEVFRGEKLYECPASVGPAHGQGG